MVNHISTNKNKLEDIKNHIAFKVNKFNLIKKNNKFCIEILKRSENFTLTAILNMKL